MPRRARLDLPPIPLHITHRGVNRAAVFVDAVDRRHYLTLLASLTAEHEVAVHAYVLMGNHVHLLTSATRHGATSATLRRLPQCNVQAFNRRHRRTGTLWEGRFKSCLVSAEDYVLQAYRYIELNPVRAMMVERPERYPWSSVHANLGCCADPVVTPHAAFLALGADAAERQQTYLDWLYAGVDSEQLAVIRAHLAQERALGDRRFQAMVEKALNRPVAVRPGGRARRERGPGSG